jgi:hypothetical protein
MWEPTWELSACFFAFMLVVLAFAVNACMRLYRLWSRHFRNGRISSVVDAGKLLGWLVLVAATIFGIIVISLYFWYVVTVLG